MNFIDSIIDNLDEIVIKVLEIRIIYLIEDNVDEVSKEVLKDVNQNLNLWDQVFDVHEISKVKIIKIGKIDYEKIGNIDIYFKGVIR